VYGSTKAFFDEKNSEYFEKQTLLYVCKAPMRATLKKTADYITQEELWQEIDDTYSVAELTIPLHGWAKARRFVFICEKITSKTGEEILSGMESYKYQAIVTNMPAEDISPVEVWRFYNKRGTCELLIEELKHGFAVEEASQHEFKRNGAYMFVKAVAYNLLLWFKEVTMPEEMKRYQADTIRRKIICIPGNVVGNGRYKHVRLVANHWLELLLVQMKTNLDKFIDIILRKPYPMTC